MWLGCARVAPTAILSTLLVAALNVLAGPADAQDRAPPPLAVIEGAPSGDRLEAYLRGTWVVTVDGQPRTRQMIIRGLRPDGDGYALDALYGWSDVTPTAVTAKARVESGIVILDLRTQANSAIVARSVGDDRLDGVFRNPGGRDSPLRTERISANTAARALSTLPTPILPASTPTTVEMVESLLYGTWLATVGSEVRTRNLEIRSVRMEGARLIADAVYGWSEATNPKPAPMIVTVDGGLVTLDLTTSAGSRIVANSVEPDRFVGTFTDKDGKSTSVRLSLTGNVVVAAAPAGSPRAKQLTLVYIGANNCGNCSAWERNIGGGTMNSKSDLLKQLEGRPVPITFIRVQTASYMQTADEKFWPADLKWIRDKTYVGSGAPRFVLVSDGKVAANVAGRINIDRKLLPEIDRIAGKKS